MSATSTPISNTTEKISNNTSTLLHTQGASQLPAGTLRNTVKITSVAATLPTTQYGVRRDVSGLPRARARAHIAQITTPMTPDTTATTFDDTAAGMSPRITAPKARVAPQPGHHRPVIA